MPNSSDFPHLNLTFRGSFEPKFTGGVRVPPEVEEIRKNPVGHSQRLRSVLGDLRNFDSEYRKKRSSEGLPPIPADRGFLLKLPEGIDVEQFTKALGVELVAETAEGLMLVSSEIIALNRLEQVLADFEAGKQVTAGASLLDIYEKPDDERRIKNILDDVVFNSWPFSDSVEYIFDLGLQTASSTRMVVWPKVRKRKDESDDAFNRRRNEERSKVWLAAEEEWLKCAEARQEELRQFVNFYHGEILSGIKSDVPREEQNGMVFPDCIQIRVRMSGKGFKDVVYNFAHLFEIACPPDIQEFLISQESQANAEAIDLKSPPAHAPAVCVIDSGIQQEHIWLAAAIDHQSSRCFLPGVNPSDVADYVSPTGHGTKVAGAIIYPRDIPPKGAFIAHSWIQNARVLNADNQLPNVLTPENYLQQVVDHFQASSQSTKIFNHSINAKVPCSGKRMTAWGAKIDQLSHEKDVLFIQSAGNQASGVGTQTNPGIQAHIENGRVPPNHLLEPSARVANPAQSLHALTIGSVSEKVFEDQIVKSCASREFEPSGFTRSGYALPWSIVKPELVEFGGDVVYAKESPINVRSHPAVAIELLNSTLHSAPAHAKDGVGTSFAAAKVSHIAAHIQAIFPNASPLLYRALLVQSARWPIWAESEKSIDKILRSVGYGVPSLERATKNSETRITLITPDATLIQNKQLHLYSVKIPQELRSAARESRVRIDVTLAYTALPRRTRARRRGYLETWLDWESSKLGEPKDEFIARMESGGESGYSEFPWILHKRDDWGQAQETNRNRGSVQKDWAVFESFNFPEEVCLAVRAHKGWNHLDNAGNARYCLVVSFESLDPEIPIYSLIASEVQVEGEIRVSD